MRQSFVGDFFASCSAFDAVHNLSFLWFRSHSEYFDTPSQNTDTSPNPTARMAVIGNVSCDPQPHVRQAVEPFIGFSLFKFASEKTRITSGSRSSRKERDLPAR